MKRSADVRSMPCMRAVGSMSNMWVGDDERLVLAMGRIHDDLSKITTYMRIVLGAQHGLAMPSSLHGRPTIRIRPHLYRKGTVLICKGPPSVETSRRATIPDFVDLDPAMLYPGALIRRTKPSGDGPTKYIPGVTVSHQKTSGNTVKCRHEAGRGSSWQTTRRVQDDKSIYPT